MELAPDPVELPLEVLLAPDPDAEPEAEEPEAADSLRLADPEGE